MELKPVFTALAIPVMLVTTGCKTSSKDVLVRKWEIIDATGPLLTPVVKAQYIGDGNTLEFMKDDSYIAWSKGKRNDSGTYTISEDGKTLTTKTAGNGLTRTFMMKELTEDRMIVTQGTLDLTFKPSK